MDLKILKLAAELLDEINQFIDNLWLAQADNSQADNSGGDGRQANNQK